MLRPTGNRVPLDAPTCAASALPFGVLVSPLAPSPEPRLTALADSVLTDAARRTHAAAAATAAHHVPRCSACGGYISVKCNMNARYWRCALCARKNDLPPRYAATVLSAEQEALEFVPEICRDVYDVPVVEEEEEEEEDGEGRRVPPVAYVFVIDEMGDQHYLDAARTAVKAALDVIEGESLVGVMLYGEGLSLLDLRGEGIVRKVSAVDTDFSVAEAFPPSQWMRPTWKAGVNETIVNMLSKLAPPSDLVTAGKVVKRAMGAAVKAAMDMVEEAGLLAARCVVIGAGEPNFGEGAIQSAEEVPAARDRFPAPAISFYADQGVRASLLGAMVDVYLVSRMAVDVASISPLAQTSGGRLILYEAGESTLSQDVWQHLNDPAVVRGMLRLRCSPQLSVSEVYGCGVYRDGDVADVYRLSCHGHTSTLAADFGFASESGFAGDSSHAPCVQVAFRGVFLEPGALPQKVLRVETQTYSATSSLAALRKEADANATCTLVFHRAVAAADEQGIGEARMLLFDWLANLLAKSASPADDEHQTITVDPTLQKYPAIRTIPRIVFGLIRSFLFRQEAVSPDVRAALRCIWEDLSPELLAAAAYPRLFSFLNLDEKSIKEVALSSAAVNQSGHPIFLLDAFSDVVIYYASSFRRDLTFPPPESSLVMRVRAASIRDRPVTPKCLICREGTQKDRWFKSFLIEDPLPGAAAQSFSAFMQGVTDSARELIELPPKRGDDEVV